MTSAKTMPSLQEALLQRLRTWQTQQPLLHDPNWPPDVRQAIQEQDAIGWKNMIEGIPCKNWQLIQQRYYDSIGSPKTGKRWLLGVLKRLNDTAFDTWKHRDDILHRVDKTHLQEANALLNTEITHEFQLGLTDLPRKFHHYFHWPLASILQKSSAYKRGWVDNLQTIRASVSHPTAPSEKPLTETQSRLFRWMKTGRLTPN
ncbi:MAG TPA: hypothetical protein V6D20_19085 [Candidatus Obscuribacterales bacterium]